MPTPSEQSLPKLPLPALTHICTDLLTNFLPTKKNFQKQYLRKHHKIKKIKPKVAHDLHLESCWIRRTRQVLGVLNQEENPPRTETKTTDPLPRSFPRQHGNHPQAGQVRLYIPTRSAQFCSHRFPNAFLLITFKRLTSYRSHSGSIYVAVTLCLHCWPFWLQAPT